MLLLWIMRHSTGSMFEFERWGAECVAQWTKKDEAVLVSVVTVCGQEIWIGVACSDFQVRFLFLDVLYWFVCMLSVKHGIENCIETC